MTTAWWLYPPTAAGAPATPQVSCPRLTHPAVTDSDGRTVDVEFRIRSDTVEVSLYPGPCSASLHRDALASWLQAPSGILHVDDVELLATASGEQIFLTVTDQLWNWPLPSPLRAQLTAYLRSPEQAGLRRG